MTGDKRLVGLPLSLLALAGVFFPIPLGKLADKIGRKPTTIICTAMAGCGLAIMAWSVMIESWGILLLGATVCGAGISGAVIYILAVTDMFPPQRKGEASGIINLGAYIGAAGGPLLGGIIASAYGLSYSFILGSVVVFLAVILLFWVSPDPLEIGIHLDQYYPDLEGSNPTELKSEVTPRSLKEIFRLFPIQVQFWSRILIHSPRVILFILTPIVLSEYGYSMALVGTVIMAMGIGMLFASFPVGKLADKYGRKKMIILAAIISLIAIVLEIYTTNITLLIAISFCVGLGFAMVNTVAPSMVADITHPVERGMSMGVFGMAAGSGFFIFPALCSWIYGSFGLKSVGYFVGVLMVMIVLITIPLRELKPGRYDHVGTRNGAIHT